MRLTCHSVLSLLSRRKTETLGGVGIVFSAVSSVVSSGLGQDLDKPRQYDDDDDHDHDHDERLNYRKEL